jgi:hypothetical protein
MDVMSRHGAAGIVVRRILHPADGRVKRGTALAAQFSRDH